MNRLESALELVAIDSVSRNESQLAGLIESRLRTNQSLDVERVGDNVIARTTGLKTSRVIVAGHLDTVPGDASKSVIEGEELRGVGACDMKGSLAVMLELALMQEPRASEVSWIFYAREEVSRKESGLVEIAELRPDLLQGDVAILAEPTGGIVEAGCQGSLRIKVTLGGARAHSARPFTGRNAIHRLAGVLARVADYKPREVEIDDVVFTEQLQAVLVEGGVAANVVPDSVSLTLNHRVAPDRDQNLAAAWLKDYLAKDLDDGDVFEIEDWAPAAKPALTNERLQRLVALTKFDPKAKMGWTDVATFQSLAIPATNFGAGDPLLAHRSDEFITRSELDEFASVLNAWLSR